MNMGDLFYQLIIYAIFLGLVFAVYFFIRSIVTKNNSNSNAKNIENKLDRIIELLEKDKLK